MAGRERDYCKNMCCCHGNRGQTNSSRNDFKKIHVMQEKHSSFKCVLHVAHILHDFDGKKTIISKTGPYWPRLWDIRIDLSMVCIYNRSTDQWISCLFTTEVGQISQAGKEWAGAKQKDSSDVSVIGLCDQSWAFNDQRINATKTHFIFKLPLKLFTARPAVAFDL